MDRRQSLGRDVRVSLSRFWRRISERDSVKGKKCDVRLFDKRIIRHPPPSPKALDKDDFFYVEYKIARWNKWVVGWMGFEKEDFTFYIPIIWLSSLAYPTDKRNSPFHIAQLVMYDGEVLVRDCRLKFAGGGEHLLMSQQDAI
ncbi:hypothetical protein BC937DRAFT_93713 [Endogone sp. FLAS-F59071]|nr:hypothetical protein BC937DRAFT_93713 [Endogone sp. FLAS-F59071]|eukprot:RUS14501.1 hypothetical protein BC937DRAFT_93713 [Endogone sp. FLAS-F59071]